MHHLINVLFVTTKNIIMKEDNGKKPSNKNVYGVASLILFDIFEEEFFFLIIFYLVKNKVYNYSFQMSSNNNYPEYFICMPAIFKM